MLWADAMDLCKDVAVTKVTSFSVLDDGFETWFLNCFFTVVFLFSFHLLLMNGSKQLLVLDEVIGVNPELDLTRMDEVYALRWVTLLVEELSGTKVDRLELVDYGVVELFGSAPEEFDLLEHFTMSLGNDLVSQVNRKL